MTIFKKMRFLLAISWNLSYIINMISVRKNPSFPQFFQVFSFGEFVDEVQGRAKALRIAKKKAKEEKTEHINFLGKVVDSDS